MSLTKSLLEQACLSADARDAFEALVDESIAEKYYEGCCNPHDTHPAAFFTFNAPINGERARNLLIEMWGGILTEEEIDAACDRFVDSNPSRRELPNEIREKFQDLIEESIIEEIFDGRAPYEPIPNTSFPSCFVSVDADHIRHFLTEAWGDSITEREIDGACARFVKKYRDEEMEAELRGEHFHLGEFPASTKCSEENRA